MRRCPQCTPQIRELEHQIFHLQRSNTELEDHLRELGHDRELRQAIGENIVAIAKRRAIIDDLLKMAPMPRECTPVSTDGDGDVAMLASAETAAEHVTDAAAGVYL
mmetsp:Transcript_52711/g.114984  ORF Transcript_52711/g.114984 Transcript_52711/m.114984 type:complete len:106 (+) Transcript_52711:355-672(+)